MPAIRPESIGVSASAVPPASPAPLQSHPPGLFVVCLVGFFERVTGGILAALLALYLNERFLCSVGAASTASGYFHALAYTGCIGGGFLADRWLGYRRAVAIGCVFIGAGFLALALDVAGLLWPALALLVIGSALFKPSLASLLRRCYKRSDSRAGDGFLWFYFAANVGTVAAPSVSGSLRAAQGWRGVFGVAVAAIVLALVTLALGARHLRSEAPETGNTSAAESSDALSAALRWRAALVLLGALVAATAGFAQLTGPLMFWARDFTRRTIGGVTVPPDLFGAVPSAVAIAASPLLPVLWSALKRRGVMASEAGKVGAGLALCALAFAIMVPASMGAAGPVSPVWLLACKLTLTLGEVLVWPIAASLVSRFAPPRLIAASLGVMFVVNAIGYWIGGGVAGLWARVPASQYFALLALGLGVATVLFALTSRHITRALASVEVVNHA